VSAVVDLFGPADLRIANQGTDARSIQVVFGIDAYEDMGFASPVTYVTSDDPSFLIMHGEEDDVVPIAHRIIPDINKRLNIICNKGVKKSV
ncbi:MAG: hypothetical protein UY72_C0059G0008, partial [Candidatus Uhrbacteria bacterium GW2011_GWD2_52_7]